MTTCATDTLNFNFILISVPRHAPYEAGQFADSAGRIGAQFGEVAKLLLEVTNDIGAFASVFIYSWTSRICFSEVTLFYLTISFY